MKKKYTSTNAEMVHYMKMAGVRPIDRERNWRTSWPDALRERVARYCVMRYMASKQSFPNTEAKDDSITVPSKPQVLR